MKKLIVALLIAVLLICTFVLVFRSLLDKPLFGSTEKVNVYLDGIKDNSYEHIFMNDQIYIDANYLIDNELLDCYWDEEYNKLSIFDNYKYEVIRYNNEKAFYNKSIYDIDEVLLINDNKLYLNTRFIKENYINRLYMDANNLNVIIEENIREYEMLRKSKLKTTASSRTSTLKILNTGEHIYVYNNECNGWILARTEENIIGYIKLSDLKPISKVRYDTYHALNKGDKINMAWDLIYSKIEDFEPFDIPSTIDIVGPTWFDLEDNDEIFKDLSNDDYIKYVKDSNKDIWAVFNNSFDPELTSKLLNDGVKRSEIVDKIIQITEAKKFDAINLDFENIYLKDKAVFSAFLKELYCKAREKDILLTVDITIMSNSENWSLCYDRNVISNYSDYIMLMAYDENVSGVPGSVSSLPWVEFGVENILQYASSEKIVLSIPFYTRLWEQYEHDNDKKIKSTALKIKSAQNVLEELAIKLEYDDATGQNYGKTTIDGITYTIWNEDKTSLGSRMEIIKKYNLAGCAVWALRYGTDEMWNLIE